MLISRIIYEWMNLNFVRGRNSEMDVIFLKGTESDVHDKFFFFLKKIWIEERIIHTDRSN